MERATFIEQAPIYYAAAIVIFLDKVGSQVSASDVISEYSEYDQFIDDTYHYFEDGAIFNKALSWLLEKDVVAVVDDHFGPLIFGLDWNAEAARDRLIADNVLAFKNLERVNNKAQWIRSALKKLHSEKIKLAITDEDFETLNHEWEPIPLDREDKSLQAAITKVDDTVDQLRGDNGYAANHPEERRVVLSGLAVLLETLKTGGSVSRSYLQTYGLIPLRMLTTRFGKAALGIAAVAAREALLQWAKEKGFNFLKSWLS